MKLEVWRGRSPLAFTLAGPLSETIDVGQLGHLFE
jgi:hypothetical protein